MDMYLLYGITKCNSTIISHFFSKSSIIHITQRKYSMRYKSVAFIKSNKRQL